MIVGCLTLAVSMAGVAQEADGLADSTGSITTVAIAPQQPTPSAAATKTLHLHVGLHLQTVPIMEIGGIHAEILLQRPFGNSALADIGISAGVGYSIYTPHFVPILLRTLWGNKHYLEVDVGNSIPLNPVYGTNPDHPLTWPTGKPNITILVGYRFHAPNQSLVYRVFMQAVNVPGVNGGFLPCLGGSIGIDLL